uniref:Uncharacterized protein LOC100179220 n=1 Tax=Phallusia mammillata TaxID=59560 RepID=A0A6F9DHR0_9ASCI|nr:uncharacterized protein LOC100179220 [Phallusia mammillata]
MDDDLKKGPALATQTSFDSDYQTGDFTNFTSSDVPSSYVNLVRGSSDPDFSGRNQPTTSGAIYQNLDDRPPAVPARDEDRNSYINLQHRHSLPPTDRPLVNVRSQQPPPRPPKKDSPSKTLDRNGISTLPPHLGLMNPSPPPIPGRRPTQEETDPLRKALVNDKLPPLPKEEEGKRAYENSAEFETTIDEVRRGTHWNGSRDRWLDIPYSVFICIAVGLEKDESVVGDWKALAEVLGLTFHNIQQLAGIARASTTLRPVEVILLHWCRTQSPLPFTRWNLRMKLVAIGRSDLAELVPLDDARRTSHDSG